MQIGENGVTSEAHLAPHPAVSRQDKYQRNSHPCALALCPNVFIVSEYVTEKSGNDLKFIRKRMGHHGSIFAQWATPRQELKGVGWSSWNIII